MDLLGYLAKALRDYEVAHFRKPGSITMSAETVLDCVHPHFPNVSLAEKSETELWGFAVKLDPAMPRGRWRLEPACD